MRPVMLIDRNLDCDIERMTWHDIEGGKYFLDRFLGKSYNFSLRLFFFTMFQEFQLGIDYNDEFLKLVNYYYLTKVFVAR